MYISVEFGWEWISTEFDAYRGKNEADSIKSGVPVGLWEP